MSIAEECSYAAYRASLVATPGRPMRSALVDSLNTRPRSPEAAGHSRPSLASPMRGEEISNSSVCLAASQDSIDSSS